MEVVVIAWDSVLAVRDLGGMVEVVAGGEGEACALGWDADTTSLWPRVVREEVWAVERLVPCALTCERAFELSSFSSAI